MKSIYTLFALLLIGNSSIFSQTTFTNTKESKVVVQGTSTVHDWESIVEEFSVNLVLSSSENGSLLIESLVFQAEAKSVKEGKRVMDKKTREALKADDFPQISFNMTELIGSTADSVTVSGELAIAGVTNNVTLTAAYKINGEVLTITGAYPLLMSDFGIEAPTAMMGTMKTGDEVTIDFELTLTEQ